MDMNLPNLYKTIENRVLDGHFFLIDYALFFDAGRLGKYTRFAIDDSSEIEQLKEILRTIRLKDPNIMIYVCAYGNELEDSHGEKFLYADSIWINGSLSKKMIVDGFRNNLNIEPSSIELLCEMEERNQSPVLYLPFDGAVIDLSMSSNLKYLENVITLYWD